MPSAILLAHIEMWVTELEREVRAFEAAVQEVEVEMEKAEHEVLRLPRLERALEKARQIEGLVHAANETLSDALDAAQLVVANEHLSNSLQPEPVALPTQATQPLPLDISERPEPPPPQPEQSEQPPIIRATLVFPSQEQQADLEPLVRGTLILNDRYRIVDVLQSRPRVNLYLAHRLTTTREQEQGAPVLPLVAIRELVLSGLSPDVQKLIEQAAFEEFVAPGMFGSPRLPGVGDRISIERGRHYLVMQLRPVRNQQASGQVMAVPLAELLLKNQQWPAWLGAETALEWGIQLARIVARLHRMGVILGWLNPATILADSSGPSAWAPVLLVSWPPALQFWSDESSRAYARQLFPLDRAERENPFAAPETLDGQADERSDVYALGALLYLFFTRYAPIAASLRQPDGQSGQLTGMTLVPPHLFSNAIPPELEYVLLRSLALQPDRRYPTVFALVEALESIDLASLKTLPNGNKRIQQDSKATRVLWGLHRRS
jgi:hypothetical protein